MNNRFRDSSLVSVSYNFPARRVLRLASSVRAVSKLPPALLRVLGGRSAHVPLFQVDFGMEYPSRSVHAQLSTSGGSEPFAPEPGTPKMIIH